MPRICRSLRHFSSFFRKEGGAISVEGVLWMPFYLFFFALIVDASMMFHARSTVLRILEDTNRHAVTGYLVDEQEVQDQIETLIARVSANATVETTWNTEDIQTVVRIPSGDLQPLGLISILSNFEVTVHAFNRFEV